MYQTPTESIGKVKKVPASGTVEAVRVNVYKGKPRASFVCSTPAVEQNLFVDVYFSLKQLKDGSTMMENHTERFAKMLKLELKGKTPLERFNELAPKLVNLKGESVDFFLESYLDKNHVECQSGGLDIAFTKYGEVLVRDSIEEISMDDLIVE